MNNNTTEAICFGFIGLIIILIAKFPNLLLKTIAVLQYFNNS